MPDEDVLCRTTFKYSHYSPPISELFRINLLLGGISSSGGSIGQECSNLVAFYQCIGTLTPCNATSMKIFTFCKDSCHAVSNLVLNCVTDISSIDPVALRYLAQFNCTNPLTYSSSLTLDYYEYPSDEICSAVRSFLGKLNV